MTAPEPTAEVLRVHRGSACASVEGRPGWLCLACSGPGRNEWLDDAGLDRHRSQAVVAAIRAMTREQTAELSPAVAQAWDEGYEAARTDLWQWTVSARDKPPQVHEAAVNPYRQEVRDGRA